MGVELPSLIEGLQSFQSAGIYSNLLVLPCQTAVSADSQTAPSSLYKGHTCVHFLPL